MSGESRDYLLQTIATINLRQQPFKDAIILKRPTRNAVVTVWRTERIPLDEPETPNKTWFKTAYDGVTGWMLLLFDKFEDQFHDITAPIPAPPMPPVPTVKVHAPFVTQVGNVNLNDCGPATVASVICWYGLQTNQPGLLDIVAGDVSDFLKHGNSTTTLTQLASALHHWGIAVHARSGASGLTVVSIRAELDAGRPVIMLVDRGALKPTFDTFTGSHFIVVTGYAPGWYFYHDPLGLSAAQGAHIPVTDSDFEKAITETPGNPGLRYAGVSIDPLPVIAPPAPPLLRWYMIAAMIEDVQIAAAKEALARLSVRSQWISVDDESIE